MASAPAMISAAPGENEPGSMTNEAPSFSKTTQACSCLVSFTVTILLLTSASNPTVPACREPGGGGAGGGTTGPFTIIGVTFTEDRATSFGNVAESYDRVRPGPSAQALD